MSVSKKSNTRVQRNTESSREDREILGYANPKGLVAKKQNRVVDKMYAKYGIPLYADDPIHVRIFEAAAKQDFELELWISCKVNPNTSGGNSEPNDDYTDDDL